MQAYSLRNSEMSKKRKIIWHLPYAVVGGVETLYATILKYIDHEKYEHIVTAHEGIGKWAQNKYRKLAKVRIFNTQVDLANTLDSIQPDMIMGTHGGTLYAALELCKRQYSVIELVHGSHIWVEHNAHMPKHWTKQIVSVSNSAQRVYERAKTVDLPHTVIINGVDTEVFNPKKPLARKSKVIGYMGRFLECDKHITKMIQAFKSIGDHHARLHLIGGTPQETVRLKHFSRSLKMGNQIKFFDHTDSPERYYKNIDVATVRSEAEGYCLTAAEALACGTPLLCYNFGGIIEHVEPGTIAVANNQQEYAFLMKEVHSNYDLRKKMRKMGLDFIQKDGNAKIMADRYEKLISEVIEGQTQSLPTKEVAPPVKTVDLLKKIPKRSKEVEIPHVGKVTINKHDFSPIVGVFDPNWHGIATATKSVAEEYVTWNRNPQITIKNILRHNPDKVLFSGMCPGFDHTIRGLKRQSKKTKIYAYYHGGISHYSFKSGLFGDGERQAFAKMIRLHEEGLIEKIAVSAPGLAEVLRANGHKAEFCGNIREHEELPPHDPLKGFHIGNWNRHHDHKHTSIGIGAAQLISRSTVHCLKGAPRIPGIDYGKVREHAEMSQERLFTYYRSMHVNLQMSFIETFNISIMEMMAAGRPLIISPSNRVMYEGNKLLESYIPKDPTNPYELAKLIEKAAKNADQIVEEQFNHLNKLNKESKSRWEQFFL